MVFGICRMIHPRQGHFPVNLSDHHGEISTDGFMIFHGMCYQKLGSRFGIIFEWTVMMILLGDIKIMEHGFSMSNKIHLYNNLYIDYGFLCQINFIYKNVLQHL